MLTPAQKLEKFFMLYLIINPIFDLCGGIYIRIGEILAEESLTGLITPILVLRMLVLLMFVAYALIIRDKITIATVILIGIAWVMSLVGEFLFAEDFSLFADMQYIAKYVYNIAVLLVYWRVLQRSGLNKEQLEAKLNWYISLTLTILSSSILFAYVFGLGYATYGDRWGVSGSRGFFYSGNDITAVLMLLLPIAIASYVLLEGGLSRRQKLFWLFAPASTITALFIISTKTAFVAIVIIVATFLIYSLIQLIRGHSAAMIKRFGMLVVGFVGIYLFLTLASQAANFLDLSLSFNKWARIADETGLDGLLLSGRQDILSETVSQFKDSGIFAWLFGIGRGTQVKLIEMDIFEVVLYYGLFGSAAMLWLYLKLGMQFIGAFFKKVDIVGLACFVSLGMTVAYLTIAGHVLFSVTSGFYFALVLLYSCLYYAPSVELFQIIKCRKCQN